MSSDWISCTVTDIAAPTKNALVGGPFGSNLVSRDYVPLGIPVIRGQNMGYGRWIGGEFAYVSIEKAEELSPNTARPGDLIFTQRGTLGQVSIVPNGSHNRYIVSQSQMKLTVDERKADPLFVYYCFCMEEQQDYIRRNAIQTGVPHTNLGHLRNTPLLLPPLSTQRAIAHILGALDDKIELNRKMNETLEQLARALFKSWFVDFDPVRAKAEGRKPVGMDAETVALFPDSFEGSVLGEVPRGWMVRSLDEIAEFLNGLALQKYPPKSDEYLPVIKIAQMRKNDTDGADKATVNIDSAYVVNDGDVLFSWSGSLEVILWCGGKGALNQHLFKVSSKDYAKWFYYLWTHLHLPDFQQIAAGKATTMGHIQRHHLHDALVVVPTNQVLNVADTMFVPLLNRIILNEIESRTLSALRDTLLPKLMSGEVKTENNEVIYAKPA